MYWGGWGGWGTNEVIYSLRAEKSRFVSYLKEQI